MSISRRSLVRTRASMTTIVSPEPTDLKSFIKNCLKDARLEELVLVCVDTSNKSKQVHIRFEKGNEPFYKIGRITYFENYLKSHQENFEFSHVGRIHEVLTRLIKEILFKLVPIKTETSFTILMTSEKENWDIDINRGFLHKVDKTEEGSNSNNTCPICFIGFEKKEKFTLRCKHSICSECFWHSIDNNLLTCPMCRHPFFTAEA